MAEKKYLDLTGLGQYTVKIKAYADNAATAKASKVDTEIRKDYKVKDIDKTTDNGKVSLTLNENGVLGVTVNADVVKDSEYSTVKTNANNSAAAWGKFLEGTTDLYPNNVTPGLKDLATDANARSYASTAKSEAITEAGKLDGALETKITAAYGQADEAVKTELIGTKDHAGDTIWGAKKYADEKVADAKAAADTAKAAADVAKDAADGAQSTADAAKAAAKVADDKAVAAQGTADEIKNTTIPNLQKSLEGKITANTNLIGTTKNELIGGELDTKESPSIKGAKLYAEDLADGLSTRINSIVAGGVAFKGVVTEMPSNPQNGDLVIIGKEGGIKVGDITYKKDYEYIYSEGAWYELGDSDKNAKAIATVESKVNSNTNAISALDTAYKAADTAIKQSIETLSSAAVKTITGGNSTYVTVTAGTKDDAGNVTLTVSDSIATTFDTKTSVDDKISTAKNDLIGTKGQDGNTIWGAKNYAEGLVSALDNSFVAITADEIKALFP